ncbi:hypothetical protein NPIL_9471 [Nephila pilipes]|uniref:Uncharacterized protein n=1 Tax=Nephila pilipes TaxID=299642 RepID=A0A8X6UJ77_NEPPI|nr:hypothetical protein NPIL_9471 [Nephila pilipes]
MLKTVEIGDNVRVWGCMGYSGAGNLQIVDKKMTALSHIDVLRHNLKEKIRVEETLIFQQDPKHAVIKTKEWLLCKAPQRFETPLQSPDHNQSSICGIYWRKMLNRLQI